MLDLIAPTCDCSRRPAALRYAATLAAWLDGSLTALYLPPPAGELPALESGPLQQELLEILRGEEEARRDAAAGFGRWARQHHVTRTRWCTTTQALEPALRAAADWHHLAVLERDIAGGDALVGGVGRLLLETPLPFVLVPSDLPEDTPAPTVIALAWNGSREALRAVHAALPLLRRASRIELLHSAAPAALGDPLWQPPQTLERYLAWQGLSVATATVLHDDEPETLFALAAKRQAQLLVMGAYGSGRYAEWLFGGATAHALRHGRLPLFLRH